MAGAGYKLFNTGDVLTAAQVNTYLMEQTVMVFADAAARTTALTGVVSEGMISYLKDTNAVEVYNGSAWVSSDDPNAIQNTIVDAKGDLITATAADTPARLAVGNNGDTLLADSSATTGLRWQGDYAAGKNAIINGDFRINQRAFTSSTVNGYGFDRFVMATSGGTGTYSAQTFTAGSAPVTGYEGTNYARLVTTGQSAASDFTRLEQPIEGVRNFANQTVTLSFWAQAGSANPDVSVEIEQNFGTGGSTFTRTYAGKVTLSTSWTRYSITVALPSISGKTIDNADNSLKVRWYVSAGSNFDARTGTLGIQSNTFNFWGMQLESGNVATAFQTATGTLQGELAACQRYYYRIYPNANSVMLTPSAICDTTTSAFARGQFPVTMRTKPTALEQSGTAGDYAVRVSGAAVACSAVPTFSGATTEINFSVTCTTASGLTAGQAGSLQTGASTGTAAYLGWSAEL